MENQTERTRSFNGELKSDGNIIEGYAVLYDTPTVVTDWLQGRVRTYTEIIRRGAFKKSLEGKRKIPAVVNHRRDDVPLASFPKGKLTLEDRERGLWVSFPCPASRQDVKDAVADGVLTEWSFQFKPTPTGEKVRGNTCEVVEAGLQDVSLVHEGAYPGTEASLREKQSGYAFRKRQLELEKI